MSATRIAVLYVLFAAIATGVNLGCQAVVLAAWDHPRAVLLALVVGTVAGMPVKYVLDKRYIFRFQAQDLGHETRMFVLYVALAGITTVVFWGSELILGAITGSDVGHLIGGGIGLAIGYAMKYRMDRAWVFVDPAATDPSTQEVTQ